MKPRVRKATTTATPARPREEREIPIQKSILGYEASDAAKKSARLVDCAPSRSAFPPNHHVETLRVARPDTECQVPVPEAVRKASMEPRTICPPRRTTWRDDGTHARHWGRAQPVLERFGPTHLKTVRAPCVKQTGLKAVAAYREGPELLQ